MYTTMKAFRTLGLIILISISVNTITKAQSPADDPGIGGPGSPTVGVGADSGPVVPFDRNMNLLLLASGVLFVANRTKKLEVNL